MVEEKEKSEFKLVKLFKKLTLCRRLLVQKSWVHD